MSEAKGVGGQPVLQDVVACILGIANAKAAITARVEKHGGRVAPRLGKEVSHIVWERRHSRRPSDKAADESELLELFHKLEKMEYPPVVVSPLWVEESIKAGRRLVERKYLVKKPTESLLGRTPGTGAAAAKKRKRPAAVPLPKPAEAYDIDDLNFSSTQQMKQGGAQGDAAAAGPSHDVTSPRDGAATKQQRQGGGGVATRGAKKQQAGNAMPTVAELLSEGKAEPPTQLRAGRVGTETQAVANILTIDLPDDDCHLGRTPGGFGAGGGGGGEDDDEEWDELDTPLALRIARNSPRGWGASGGSLAKEQPNAAGAGPAAGPAEDGSGGDKRSRLAQASGPCGKVGEQAAADRAGEAEGMEVDEQPADAGADVEQQQRGEASPLQSPDGPQQEAQAAEQKAAEAARAAAAAKGVAERFSVRQLVRHPERPVLLHKGTPLAAVLPPSPAGAKPSVPIPIPVVERVPSPWTLAEQLPTQSPAASQLESAAGRPTGSGRPSLGLAKPSGRRSLLGVSNMRGVSGAGSTPSNASHAVPAGEDKLPTPWSTLRPWDAKAAQLAAAAAASPDGDENRRASDEPQQPQPKQQQQPQNQQQMEVEEALPADQPEEQQHGAPPAGTTSGSAGGTAGGPGPSHGCIALSSVDAGVVELTRSATRRLRGMRLCPEGREEGQVTHLVIGGERRTLKLMLAVANGAWLLSPQWVTASLEAGRWLPESQFPANVRFEAAAERARSLLEALDAQPLLHDRNVYVHLPEKARKLMAANVTALKRVLGVLGAKVAPPKTCNLCIVLGGGARPPHIPKKALCVKEEWLLQAAERFELPAVEEFALE